MKIDDRAQTTPGLGQLGQPAPATRPATPGAADPRTHGTTAGERPAATVEVSNRARELHAALRAVRDAPDTRADVVADVRSRLADGRYRLDAEATARRILDRRA